MFDINPLLSNEINIVLKDNTPFRQKHLKHTINYMISVSETI